MVRHLVFIVVGTLSLVEIALLAYVVYPYYIHFLLAIHLLFLIQFTLEKKEYKTSTPPSISFIGALKTAIDPYPIYYK